MATVWNRLVLLCTCILLCISLSSADGPISLNGSNWRDMLEGEWLVKFYAPWCPACKALFPAWSRVATWMDELNIKVGKVDVTENPELSGRFLVVSLPTIYHVKDAKFRQYKGTREESDFYNFIKTQRWRDIEPLSWWRDPNSIQMGALGFFFRASMLIRGVHATITEDYGIPEWGSYIVFAVATIISGLLIGLCLVCCCDILFPPRPPAPLPEDQDETDDVEDDLEPKGKQDEGAADSGGGGDEDGSGDDGARRRKLTKAE